jgi:dihydrofolate reductase
MSKVFFDTGLSLEGFMAGENRGPRNPLGDNGPSILDWMFRQKAFWRMQGGNGGEDDGPDGKEVEQVFARTGVYIMGKRMFEEGEANWPEDLFKTPVYVLTHEKREPWVQKGSTVFYFTNEDIASVLKQAKAAAQDKDVRVIGGADTIRQYLNAGLVDEFTVHIAPLILGSGIRLFDKIDREKVKVSIVEAIHSPWVMHLKYVVNK